MTKDFLGHVQTARDLLRSVADGDERSVELAMAMARSILDAPVVQQALALQKHLSERSPFALVRAVELAEILLGAQSGVEARTVLSVETKKEIRS